MASQPPEIPQSVTTGWINMIGLASAMAAFFGVMQVQSVPIIWAAFGLMCAYAVPIAILELTFKRVHWNPSSGINHGPARYDPLRSATKFIGLIVLLTAVVGFHAVFRVYPVQDLMPAFGLLIRLAPVLLFASFLYILWVDARMPQPHDGYWQIGARLTCQARSVKYTGLHHFYMGWVIKGFFLPIMFSYLVNTLAGSAPPRDWFTQDIVPLTRHLMLMAILLELVVVCVGYTLTLRLFDAHIRTTNPVLWGWVVTLACYAPFNTVITGQIFSRDTGVPWHETILANPLLAGPWLVLLLLSFGVWVWATASFGLRWSNLTNRGVVTCGPYRWMKHPDYMSKVMFFWLTSAPFLAAVPVQTQIAATAGMIVVTIIYFGRAKAEELHMSEDPDYVRYATALNTRGLCAPIYRTLPALAYSAPNHALHTIQEPSHSPVAAE
mgnify:FL=1